MNERREAVCKIPESGPRLVPAAELFACECVNSLPFLLATRFDDEMVAQALDAANGGGCEADGPFPQAVGEAFLRHLAAGGLGLRLRTDTAHHCDVALAFVEAVRRRLLPAGSEIDGLCLAVHEAVINAIVHGNLELDSPSNDPESFAVYCERLDERLEDPDWAGRGVEISAAATADVLEVAVRDEGPGYRPHPPSDDKRRHGLDIIADVADITIGEDGRLTLLRFPVAAPGAGP